MSRTKWTKRARDHEVFEQNVEGTPPLFDLTRHESPTSCACFAFAVARRALPVVQDAMMCTDSKAAKI